MGGPQPRLVDLGLDLLAQLDAPTPAVLTLVLGEPLLPTRPPQGLLVGEDLGVDELGRAASDVVDLGIQGGYRRHVDRHSGLLVGGPGCRPSSWPSGDVPGPSSGAAPVSYTHLTLP